MISIDTVSREAFEDTRRAIGALPAHQQPIWRDDDARDEAISSLERSVPLVSESEIAELKDSLRAVATGNAFLLQAGDCAEPMTDTSSSVVENKAQALDVMSRMLERRTHAPVVRVGRIAGQFAKPRSQSHETVGGSLIPTYRGSLVNDPYPSARARVHEPERLVRARAAAEVITQQLRCRGGERIWTSHEALVLDYELPQIRPTSDGRAMLRSAHTIWVGARTSQLDHAHVALAASIINPVGCKVSAGTTPDDLVSLANVINPNRETCKLMLIARMGASVDRLPALMSAVKREGHPAIWLCDPMHGNTRTAADGRKTRYLEAIKNELMGFQQAARGTGVIAGGAHLETTIDDVKECLINVQDVREGHDPYTSLCDPRLTIRQAVEVLSHWDSGA
ncbi:3-deoxy-7-phosphoheptulonate synthase [Geodermatophilus sp. DSM 44513]|uniref:3-deoxy-7-phosphoheptulonate synthase n=1 Tax=Geodermatophilus sp. DSM 44513 TaxID=1528104 RepID=UPI00128111CE|nr:3-deoxy-7-phosphoheptulonate synthase [Geodermatophilus sp. DSM 44513]WNV75186.1 3-deoxy-7-phosphoheptulonate synthase [Geodermatophilus sp. DSM 44513]